MVDITTGQVPDAADDGKNHYVAGGVKQGAARAGLLTNGERAQAASHFNKNRRGKPRPASRGRR